MNQFAQTMTAINEIIGDVPADAAAAGRRRRAAAGRADAAGPAAANGQPPGVGQPPVDGQQMRQRIAARAERTARRDARSPHHDAAVPRNAGVGRQESSQNLEGFTEPLGQKGDEIADSIIEAVDGLDHAGRGLHAL